MNQFERIEPIERNLTIEKPLEPSKPNPFPKPKVTLSDILEAETKENHAKSPSKKAKGRPKKVHPKIHATTVENVES